MKYGAIACLALIAGAATANAQQPKGTDPTFSMATGYIYLNGESASGDRFNYNGWYLLGEYYITPRLGWLGEFTNFFGTPDGVYTNIQGYTSGPLLAFPTGTRVTPFVFTEAGAVHESAAGNITWAFVWLAGGGVNVKLNKVIDLQLIPADYILTVPHGTALNNYAAQVGLVFTFGK